MLTRVTVVLEPDEYEALMGLATVDLRSAAAQLRSILRQELTRRGLWSRPQSANTGDDVDEEWQ